MQDNKTSYRYEMPRLEKSKDNTSKSSEVSETSKHLARKDSLSVKQRLRLLELERASYLGETICDSCRSRVKKSDALETWQGTVLVYCVCVRCLVNKGKELTIKAVPDAVHVQLLDAPKGEREQTILTTHDLLPSSSRPSFGQR